MNTTETQQNEIWHHRGLVLVSVLVLPLTIALGPWTLHAAAGVPEGNAAVQEAYGKLPLVFETNRGQADPQVKFLSRSPGHTLFLTPTDAVLVLSKREAPAKDRLESRPKATRTVLRMAFLGANAKPRVTGQEELPGKASYFIGNDRAKWHTSVPMYARVHYQELYPGIDLVYYGNQRHLEYDLVVATGADPSRIVLGFEGADRVEVDAQGDLVLHTALGPIRQRRPVIYQEVDGVKQEIPGGYVLTGEHQVGFKVAAYDARRPLVIDPVLLYSTYLGGGSGDSGLGIAVDAAGNAYVTGFTDSSDFPTTKRALQRTSGGRPDAFVTKLNPTGTALVYSTYLGGSAHDSGLKIAVDAAGNAYVTGFTDSSDFPTTPGAFQTTFGGGPDDAFVTKLNPTGSRLIYSTYLGGSDDESGTGIAVDSLSPHRCGRGEDDEDETENKRRTGAANAYVTGTTVSANFPVTAGAFQTVFGGRSDAFVTKLNPIGFGLIYSTYLGGSDGEIGTRIAVDAAGNAYVTGGTGSTNFPTTPGTFQAVSGGRGDAFVTKLGPLGSGLIYSTYLGGSSNETGHGIAVDAAGNAYVTGSSGSTDLPTTAGAFQPDLAGSTDAFVTKVNSLGMGLVYSTYLGGSGVEFETDIAVDSLSPHRCGRGDDEEDGEDETENKKVRCAANAYVTGTTVSASFPVTAGAIQTALGDGMDTFVAKIAFVIKRDR